jgi:hypothetical protein
MLRRHRIEKARPSMTHKEAPSRDTRDSQPQRVKLGIRNKWKTAQTSRRRSVLGALVSDTLWK